MHRCIYPVMKTLGFSALSYLAYGIPAMLLFLHVLHFILPKKLDKIWFNDKFFNYTELSIYSSYPLSIVRTVSYACAICLPLVVKKRFGDLSPVSNINSWTKLLCYLWLILFLIGVMAIITIFVLPTILP